MIPTLDYVPRLDDRNRAYRVTEAPELANLGRLWTPARFVTDQGEEGACVGHGVTNNAMASPERIRLADPNGEAFAVYNAAKRVDEWEGVDYDGTSVRAGMLVGRTRGWWTGFRWALSMPELRAALELGPVTIGVEWREDMYEAPGGQVRVGGKVVGGHCLLITGYSPKGRWRWRNSWGRSYGDNGSAWIRSADLESILFKSGGEAAVAVGRS